MDPQEGRPPRSTVHGHRPSGAWQSSPPPGPQTGCLDWEESPPDALPPAQWGSCSLSLFFKGGPTYRALSTSLSPLGSWLS